MSDPHPIRDRAPLAAAVSAPGRLLVVANQTATSAALIADLCGRAARGAVRFHLVVPALNGRLHHWLSDIDEALSIAERRRSDGLAVLRSHGLVITGEVGDSVPLLAIEDGLARFQADGLVISTLPEGRSHWLEHNLVSCARDRFDIPVWHVIADDDVSLAA